MNFLDLSAFAFAATLPVVILFYLLKRKRVVKLVSSSLLWQKFLAETQASSPFQKLRNNWLLILQLLLLALAVLALSRPYFAGHEAGGKRIVVILDASASMKSTDVSPSRFEVARNQAMELVSSLKTGDQMVVLQAGANTEVKQSPTTERAALRRAIQSCEPGDTPTRLVEALKLSKTLIQNIPDAEIHLFSDGAIPDLSTVQIKDLPAIYHKLGESSDNLGIVELDVRAHPEDPSQKAVFASVANYSDQPQETSVELRFNDRLLETRNLSVKPGETEPLVFTAAQYERGVFTVRLSREDAMAADNEASMVSLLPQPAKVLLLSQGNRFLEKALNAIELVELTSASTLLAAGSDYDVVVLDSTVPATWPTANLLAINVAAPGWFDGVSAVQKPPIVDWKHSHALLRYVSFDNVAVSEAMGVTTPSWAEPVVESQQTPLVLAGELNRQSIVWVGFDTLDSTWPLRVSFPIFIANAINWLNPAAANAAQLALQGGAPFRFTLDTPASEVRITRPDGNIETLPLEGGSREILYGKTSEHGVYTLTAGTNSTQFCVNLLDSNESNNQPKEELQFGEYTTLESKVLRKASTEIWRWFLAVGLAVLLFEWWFYHRRTA